MVEGADVRRDDQCEPPAGLPIAPVTLFSSEGLEVARSALADGGEPQDPNLPRCAPRPGSQLLPERPRPSSSLPCPIPAVPGGYRSPFQPATQSANTRAGPRVQYVPK